MKQKFTSLSIKDQNKSNTVTFYVDKEKGVVVCRLYDRWYDIYHVGKAHCLNTDKFNEKHGRALAFNRARKKELNFNIKMIDLERNELKRFYDENVERLNKREHLNRIYLAGVEDDIAELA